MDIVVDGQPIKAVAQVTKQGFAFVFDRVTGKPVWPIVETPVPPSTVPGERASPTQPNPSRPAPFDRQGVTVDDQIDFSPALREQAKQIVAPYDHGALYTPPSLKGTINLPGWGGGANWWGAAFDPDERVLYVPSATGPMVVKLREADPAQTDFAYVRSESVNRISGPEGLPLTRPPYGRITAIDMDSGDHLWMVPHGDGPRQKLISLGFDDPGPLGAPGTGPLVTASLLFLAQADTSGNLLRAYDKATGAVVAEIALPAAPWGTPMTFMTNGVQYIAIASGAAGDAHLVALALPDDTTSSEAR
jgi:quinoprotein glucose dehydrogenase